MNFEVESNKVETREDYEKNNMKSITRRGKPQILDGGIYICMIALT